jgi:hypothetical protein
MSDTKKVAGYIGYYGLSEWWFGTFSEEERNHIIYRVRTMRAGPKALIEGAPYIGRSTHSNVSFFLINLAHWFRRPEDTSIGRRIIFKAYALAEDIIDVGWSLEWIIRLYYPVRDQVPGTLKQVIDACKQHIEIAPRLAEWQQTQYPRTVQKYGLGKHEGYSRYVIILEKKKEYGEAIRLCQEAQQQGWAGDWDKRIERCRKRLNKSGTNGKKS